MKKIILPLLAISLLTGCKKDKEEETVVAATEEKEKEEEKAKEYAIPETYEFGESVSYGGQTDRLDMLEHLKIEVSKSHEVGASVDANTLKDMFDNKGGDGTAFDGTKGTDDQVIGSSGKNLSGKTEGLAKAAMYDILDEVEEFSGKESVGNSAGLVDRKGKWILVNAKGQEYAQLVEKGLMGSCFYNQIVKGYLSDEKIGKDVSNTDKEEGKKYTKKQHHFDEAFGYFGITKDWKKGEEGARFWGKYCNKRDEALKTNSIFEDFIAGRAAIDNDVHDNQIDPVKNIKSKIEKVAAGTAINYLNASKDKTGGDKKHALTEGLCFLRACMYGGDLVSAGDVTEIEKALNDGNFWTITDAQIDAAVKLLADASGLDATL
jgi:hypothetical protein